jgi:acetolactate decarboxylase
MKCGGLTKQEQPFEEGLDVLIPNRPVFEAENISGTMVGFYCPKFIGNINVAGYHFHFISDDKKFGGHVMEYESNGKLSVALDKMNNYHFYLPDNDAYENVRLEKEFQYKKE